MHALIEEDDLGGIRLYGPFTSHQDAWEARARIAKDGLFYGVARIFSPDCVDGVALSPVAAIAKAEGKP